MNLQEKIKICQKIADKKKYNAIKFDFKKQFIASTSGSILLKINHNFNINNNKYQLSNFLLNNNFSDQLIKHLDIEQDLFDVLQAHKNTYLSNDVFPDIDRLSFNCLNSVDSITYSTKNLLSITKVCDKLKMEHITFNFNSAKSPSQIKNNEVEILFMPITN